MLDINKIYQIDVLEGLKQLEDNSVDLIIFSPPYNKLGLRGNARQVNNSNYKSTYSQKLWVQAIQYGGDFNVDNMKEEDYEQWQVEILNECYRVLKEDGSIFYNHKNRLNKGQSISPYKWLYNTKLIVRQEIVWDRNSTCILAPIRWLPTTERVYWLTKTTHPRFYRNINGKHKTEVWKINMERNNSHPAPYPLELIDTILDNIPSDKPLTVLDPFVGSGTTIISALKHNHNYIGFDKFKEYTDMTEERIKNYLETKNNP